MNTGLKKALLIIFLFATASAYARPLRILSYNVHHCAPAESDSARYDGLAAYIVEAAPDVVALQELDQYNGRTTTSQIRELERRTGMDGVFAKAIDYRDGGYGIGLLFKRPPLTVSEVPLPGEEARAMIVATFDDYIFLCVHLCLSEHNQGAAAAIIDRCASALAAKGKPIFLAGDFNTGDFNGPCFTTLSDRWQVISGEQLTYPNLNPSRRIDFILSFRPTAPAGMKIIDKGILPGRRVKAESLSDHLPIFTDLKF